MYEILDEFISTATWDHIGAQDEERFFQALGNRIADEAFDPNAMGDYMAKKAGLATGETSEQIQYYVDAATAVRAYLKAQRSR